jgi:predicted N-acetyltransferase YhbS
MATSRVDQPDSDVERLAYKMAEPSDFEAIHRFNYETFVEEIPQHAPNPERRLVDRFHAENTYVICLADHRLVGMVCGRCTRPFSLDQKLTNLDQYLPAHRKVVEMRLLAVAHAYRKTSVFSGLMALLSRHFIERGCDLAVISGTVRQLKLYRHLGFEPFGERVGSAGAIYQPMYLTLDAFSQRSTSGRKWTAFP